VVPASARVARTLRRAVKEIILELNNVSNQLDNILALVLEKHLDGLVDKRIVHEGAINRPKVIF